MADFIIASKGTIFYLGTLKSPYPVFELDIATDDTSRPHAIECNLLPYIRTGKDWLPLPSSSLEIYSIIKGLQWHVDGFGEVCELCAKVRDTNNSEDNLMSILFYAGNFTRSYTQRDIATGIIEFFNNLLRFQTIEDYLLWDSTLNHKFKKDALKRNGEKPLELDLEDKILQIADVLKLYKKYISINPVFTYKAELRKWISINLKKLLTEDIN